MENITIKRRNQILVLGFTLEGDDDEKAKDLISTLQEKFEIDNDGVDRHRHVELFEEHFFKRIFPRRKSQFRSIPQAVVIMTHTKNLWETLNSAFYPNDILGGSSMIISPMKTADVEVANYISKQFLKEIVATCDEYDVDCFIMSDPTVAQTKDPS